MLNSYKEQREYYSVEKFKILKGELRGLRIIQGNVKEF